MRAPISGTDPPSERIVLDVFTEAMASDDTLVGALSAIEEALLGYERTPHFSRGKKQKLNAGVLRIAQVLRYLRIEIVREWAARQAKALFDMRDARRREALHVLEPLGRRRRRRR